MDETNRAKKEDAEDAATKKRPYNAPTIVDVGNVEEMTHGSREQTSDEPGSGYRGG